MATAADVIRELAQFTLDPLRFTRAVFPWGESELRNSQGPRKWQAEVLSTIGKHLQNRATRTQPLLIAVASGHDIGKSALVGMITKWALSTCDEARVMITANTGNQLRIKTQPEVAKWFRLAADKFFWEVTATRINCRDEKLKTRWRADFETWSENNTEAFQGLHNEGKRIVVIFDEASGIPKPIWEAASGVLLDENTEIIWLVFGNPTQNTGNFRECFGAQKHRWITKQIDSREVEGTNKEQIDKWIEDYGEDSDFVRVRVRGEFPRAGSAQFIASDVVAACRKYRSQGHETLPKILSIDVARFGDDQTVFGLRQGRRFEILKRVRGKSLSWSIEQAIKYIEEITPDATIIDADGLGAGVFDGIAARGYSRRLFEFHGGASANDSAAYYNRRTECWGAMRDFLVAQAEIPDDAELAADLTGPEYGFSNKNQLQLEKKEDMKARGLSSPDCGDCLAMTFAVHVAPPAAKPKTQYVYPGQLESSWMS